MEDSHTRRTPDPDPIPGEAPDGTTASAPSREPGPRAARRAGQASPTAPTAARHLRGGGGRRDRLGRHGRARAPPRRSPSPSRRRRGQHRARRVTTDDLADNVPAGELSAARADFTSAHTAIGSAGSLRCTSYRGWAARCTARKRSPAPRDSHRAGQHTSRSPLPTERAAQDRRAAHRGDRPAPRALLTLDDRLAREPRPVESPPARVGDKRATFATDLDKLRTGLSKATGATAALSDLLNGPGPT